MRLISGELGGRLIKTVNEPDLRPAMAKTRESVFSILDSYGIDWQDTKALDLFAGCGSLGLECLSRGAKEVFFVENNQKSFSCLEFNIAALNLNNRAVPCRQDVLIFLKKGFFKLFNLVFLDPPYRRRMTGQCLFLLAKKGWLANNALVVAEIENDAIFQMPEQFSFFSKRKYGQTTVYIWQHLAKQVETL